MGGILATFLFGFYLVPVAGLQFCATVTGVALAALLPLWFARDYLPADTTGTLNQDALPAGDTKKNAPKGRTSVPAPAKINTAIYTCAALEGAAVMAVELIAARMLAPWFGASLYVWTAVMAFTLAGLAAGYFIAGRLPTNTRLPDALWWSLLTASFFILLMHLTSGQLTTAFENVSIRTSVVLVSCLLVLPPLLCLGMVPVLLIRYVSADAQDAGTVTGRVFTISSASGILSLFITGFYIIPQYGLTNPSILVGVAVGTFPFIKLISKKKYISLLFVAVLLCAVFTKKVSATGPDAEVLYYSEGLLGQVLVADVNKYDTTRVNDRVLLVNRIGEAQINRSNGFTKWDYPNYVASICSKKPEGSKALMLGLGGGVIPNLLHNFMKFNVDVVELDERIAEVAQNYFFLNKDVNVMVDDARHYIETTTKTYDVIIIDVFHGDIAPPHMLSLECFKKERSLLNKNGILIVNFLGYLTGDIGIQGRSLYKTMAAAGLHPKLLPTVGKDEDERNCLFIGTTEEQSFSTLRSPLLLYGKAVNVDTLFINTHNLDLRNAVIYTDNKPLLDLISINAAFRLRGSYSDFTKQLMKDGVPLFQ